MLTTVISLPLTFLTVNQFLKKNPETLELDVTSPPQFPWANQNSRIIRDSQMPNLELLQFKETLFSRIILLK